MEHTLSHGMCRCCASEGLFKNFNSTYQWMGADEVYADMLKECFDVTLTTAEDWNNGGICEVCITQLRNASNFKKQVLQTENQFKKALQENLLRTSIVKEEVNREDIDLDSDHNVSEDYSGTEFEVPIKEELGESKAKKRAAKASTSRAKKTKTEDGEPSTKRLGGDTKSELRSTLQSKINDDKGTQELSTSYDGDVTISKKSEGNKKDKILSSIRPDKKKLAFNEKNKTVIMTESGEMKDSVCKITPKAINSEKRKKPNPETLALNKLEANKRLDELRKHLHNIRTVLLNSNATPIKHHNGTGYICGYCTMCCEKPTDLKTHTLEKHDDSQKVTFMKQSTLSVHLVMIDITNLKCNSCNKNIEVLEELISHLQQEHSKNIYIDIKNRIIPFKFGEGSIRCCICTSPFGTFKVLRQHMNMHYGSFECKDCPQMFITRKLLKNHESLHKKGEFKCSYCPKMFDTHCYKYYHERTIHQQNQLRNKCPHCDRKFLSYRTKRRHMEKEHGVEPRVLNCMACDKKFPCKSILTVHTRRCHLMQKDFSCDDCDMSFFTRSELRLHLVKHTGEKPFKCEICSKAYGRKCSLKEHERIHLNDRRFKCEHCGAAFVQKCSLRTHMKSKHSGI